MQLDLFLWDCFGKYNLVETVMLWKDKYIALKGLRIFPPHVYTYECFHASWTSQNKHWKVCTTYIPSSPLPSHNLFL